MSESARNAAVEVALEQVASNTTIGLGSGRSVFALCEQIGKYRQGVSAVVASSETAEYATSAGIRLVDIDDIDELECAFDGADEVDSHMQLLKGGGAAHLREKLVIGAAKRVVIIVDDSKLVERLGRRTLPVEVVAFGWTKTRQRLELLAGEAHLREGVITDGANRIIDIAIPSSVELSSFASDIVATLGVIDHGLFLDQTDELIIGHADGSTTKSARK